MRRPAKLGFAAAVRRYGDHWTLGAPKLTRSRKSLRKHVAFIRSAGVESQDTRDARFMSHLVRTKRRYA